MTLKISNYVNSAADSSVQVGVKSITGHRALLACDCSGDILEATSIAEGVVMQLSTGLLLTTKGETHKRRLKYDRWARRGKTEQGKTKLEKKTSAGCTN